MGLEELFADEQGLLSDDEALACAEVCLNCGGPNAPPPCVAACPCSIDVPKFISEVREARPLDAAATIFASNPLGATCARVCPSGDLCEEACALARVGREPVKIAMLQRYATDVWLESRRSAAQGHQTSGTGEEREPSALRSLTSNHSVAVIGAGPAGLACAAELARLGHRVTIYEQRRFAGGLVTTAIAAYKQRYEPIPQEVQAITALGVKLRFNECIDAERFSAIAAEHDAIFLGLGLGPDRLPDTPEGLPGEDLKGVWNSLAFVERMKRGVFADLDDQRAIVLGGGNPAIEIARAAVMLGAADVLVVHTGSEAQMRAYRREVEAARLEGVRFLFGARPVRVHGGWGVKAVEFVATRALGAGSHANEPDTFLIEADLVIKAAGLRPQDMLLDEFGIEHRDGLVSVDDRFRTSNPRCYAGGDCVNGGVNVVEAIRHGRTAAFAIHDQFLSEIGEPPTARKERWWPGALKDAPIGTERVNGIIRHFQGEHSIFTCPTVCRGCPHCIENCPAGGLDLDESQRIRLKDIGKCIFCGLCEDNCPEGAIWMERPPDALRATAR